MWAITTGPLQTFRFLLAMPIGMMNIKPSPLAVQQSNHSRRPQRRIKKVMKDGEDDDEDSEEENERTHEHLPLGDKNYLAIITNAMKNFTANVLFH
jgi:hypothetical protein